MLALFALFGILYGLLKGDKAASTGFLKSIPKKYRYSKKNCIEPIACLWIPTTRLYRANC